MKTPSQSPGGTNALQKYNPNEIQAAAPASWAQVKYWAGLSAKLQQGSVAAQIMAGFALNELHEQHGIKPGNKTGRNQHTEELPSDLVIPPKGKWADLVKQHAGVSDETARNWMAMARGIKSSWKKLAPQDRLRELMRVSPSDWTKDDTKLIGDAVKKATDGVSQVEFMRSIGVAKKVPRNIAPTPKPPTKPNAEQQAESLKRMALENSGVLGQAVRGSNRDFILLSKQDDKGKWNDLEVIAQIAVLEDAVKLRVKWVTHHDASMIEKIVKEAK